MITVNSWDCLHIMIECRLAFSYLKCVLSSSHRRKASVQMWGNQKGCSTFHMEAKELDPAVLRQEVQWYRCKLLCDAAEGWVWAKLEQIFKAKIILLLSRFAMPKLSFLLFEILCVSVYKIRTRWKQKLLNKPTSFWFSKNWEVTNLSISVSHWYNVMLHIVVI